MALTLKEQKYIDHVTPDATTNTTIKNALGKVDDTTATAAELNLLDTAAAGTIVNSKAVVYGSAGEVNATTLQLSGTAISSSAAELNLLDATATEPADGPWAAVERVAKAEWDFATDGGSVSAIDLGVTIPDNAIITGGFVDVITTCTSATDAGTGAISVEGADDIVAAIAISNGGNPWDAGLKDIIPDATGSTAVKTSSAQAVTFTIATEAFTAGKFNVYLYYVIGE